MKTSNKILLIVVILVLLSITSVIVTIRVYIGQSPVSLSKAYYKQFEHNIGGNVINVC